MQNMKWVTAALVCPAQTMSGVITAGSSGESRSAQIPLHTHTLANTAVDAGDRKDTELLDHAKKSVNYVQLVPNI